MAKSININVQEEINPDSCIRGVYGFYAVKDMEEIPFYVGKSINIFCRMFKGGHISDYLSGVRKNGVQKRIKEYLEKGYVIKVRILRKVEYIGRWFCTRCKQACTSRTRGNCKDAGTRLLFDG